MLLHHVVFPTSEKHNQAHSARKVPAVALF